MPGRRLADDAVGDMADQGGGNIDVIHLLDGRDNLTGDHALAVLGDDLMVEDTVFRLSLPDRQGVKAAITVTRDIDGDGTFSGLYRLAAFAVTAV